MKLIEGIDYFYEGTKMVFSREFLLARGYCCNSKCKYCPYKEKNEAEQESNQKGNANFGS